MWWVVSLLFATSWFFFLPIYRPEGNAVYGTLFILIGLTLAIAQTLFSNNPSRKKKLSKKELLLLILLIALILLSSLGEQYPYSFPAYIMAFSLIIFIISQRKTLTRLSLLSEPLFLSSVLLLVQIGILYIYTSFIVRYHYLDFLCQPIGYLLNLLGFPVITKFNIIYISADINTYQFAVTIGKLSLLFLLLILAGIVPVAMSKKITLRSFAMFLILLILYPILRFIFMMIFYINLNRFDMFYDINLMFLTFLPLVIILEALFWKERYRKIKWIRKLHDIGKEKLTLLTILIILSMFLLTGAFTFEDPGIKKSGRILIDEAHSEWENTTRVMDKEWYGKYSTYNYYCWAKWLSYYYNVSINTNKTLTYDYLKNYDILILKCPTEPYSNEEIDSIVKFVENGGGLYLIGDHTNVFGMNYYLNLVAERFGIRFKYDATYQYPSKTLSTCRFSGIRHPVVLWVDKFDFLTSCTLEIPITAENVIVGNDLLSESGTFTTYNFFKKTPPNPSDEAGFFVQSAAIKYGKGRVVAFTDSTCFSNFAMFMDGYPNYNLGVIEYLNRENTVPYSYIFLSISLSLLILSWIICKKSLSLIFTFIMFISLIVIPPSLCLFDHINKLNYTLPSERVDYKTIMFLNASDNVVIHPHYSVGNTPYEKIYNTFFVWTQRVGYIPFISNKIDEIDSNPDAVIIINPTRDLTYKEESLLRDYVIDGGNLIILDSVRNIDSTSNDILRYFGIRLGIIYDVKQLNISANNSTAMVIPKIAVYGENISYFTNDTDVCVAYKDYGAGRVIVVVDSYSFSNVVMGSSFVIPNEHQRAIYETEFYILENLVK